MTEVAQVDCYEGTDVPRGEHYPLREVYEPETVSVIEHFVEPGDFVIDAGASVGFFTCLLSNIVGPDGLVWAFEPNLESFGHLGRNIAMTAVPSNVRAFRTALWVVDQPELRLWSSKELGYTSVLPYHDAAGVEVVEARTLDSLLHSSSAVLLGRRFSPGPRFLKIDCEMAEFQILAGAEKALRAGIDCVVLEFNYHLMRQKGMTDHIIRDFMADLGYDMFLISITDGAGGFAPPVRVGPKVPMEVQGSTYMNVMFSTEEKVRSRWTT